MEQTKSAVRIFAAAVLFRMIVYMLSICVMAIFGEYSGGISFSDFLNVWNRWDSAHYINIAQNGYSGAIENGQHIFLVFYPLLPWLMRLLSMLFGDVRFCGILVSTVSYGIGCVYLWKIMEMEFDKTGAQCALLLISLFPFAFFFGSIATESLFFAAAAAFFYYLRKHRWAAAALCGAFACLTKVQGLLLAFAVLAELLYSEHGLTLLRERDWRSVFRRILCPGCVCALMLSGFAVYLLINYSVEGDPFRFLYYQREHWGNALCPIWRTFSYIKDYVTGDWGSSMWMCLWVPEFVLFFVYPAAVIYGWRKRLRPMYLVYLTVFYLLTYSSTWLISAGRYTLSALPLFMLGGKWMSGHKKAAPVVLMISGALMMIYFVGYYQGKQIM